VFVPPDGALKIVKNLGGKGFLLVVQHGGELNAPETAEAFLNTIHYFGN